MRADLCARKKDDGSFGPFAAWATGMMQPLPNGWVGATQPGMGPPYLTQPAMPYGYAPPGYGQVGYGQAGFGQPAYGPVGYSQPRRSRKPRQEAELPPEASEAIDTLKQYAAGYLSALAGIREAVIPTEKDVTDAQERRVFELIGKSAASIARCTLASVLPHGTLAAQFRDTFRKAVTQADLKKWKALAEHADGAHPLREATALVETILAIAVPATASEDADEYIDPDLGDMEERIADLNERHCDKVFEKYDGLEGALATATEGVADAERLLQALKASAAALNALSPEQKRLLPSGIAQAAHGVLNPPPGRGQNRSAGANGFSSGGLGSGGFNFAGFGGGASSPFGGASSPFGGGSSPFGAGSGDSVRQVVAALKLINPKAAQQLSAPGTVRAVSPPKESKTEDYRAAVVAASVELHKIVARTVTSLGKTRDDWRRIAIGLAKTYEGCKTTFTVTSTSYTC
ncbi:hypothetical protein GNI_180880 [Gregarina niphandrodes]|uniref:Uncharacterized protein n=1 Tax=Gregarina niphandrodes TaxID=110365 RepID=A0A023AY64_GRENI|nr:hypothetical protein GNI_180880 [Gregarina niphandrodes]EZG43235.1 hypothetical protein GNI_180880 [Gregarina niphandrodes]|eukprot:XP_011133503.1 hypothetical protein GNI_180880 [Gregarina niphandrodes]